jgi:hypothetical protein
MKWHKQTKHTNLVCAIVSHTEKNYMTAFMQLINQLLQILHQFV